MPVEKWNETECFIKHRNYCTSLWLLVLYAWKMSHGLRGQVWTLILKQEEAFGAFIFQVFSQIEFTCLRFSPVTSIKMFKGPICSHVHWKYCQNKTIEWINKLNLKKKWNTCFFPCSFRPIEVQIQLVFHQQELTKLFQLGPFSASVVRRSGSSIMRKLSSYSFSLSNSIALLIWFLSSIHNIPHCLKFVLKCELFWRLFVYCTSQNLIFLLFPSNQKQATADYQQQ